MPGLRDTSSAEHRDGDAAGIVRGLQHERVHGRDEQAFATRADPYRPM